MLQKMILVKLSSKYRRGNPRERWERLDLLFTMFGNALRNGLILNQDVRSFAGRINHYAIMVGGRTKRCLILHLHDESKAPLAKVKVRSQTKICLAWWLLNIRVVPCRRLVEGSEIQNGLCPAQQ